MKRWLAMFTAVLAAGLVTVFVADRKAESRAEERADQERKIARWEEQARDIQARMKMASEKMEWHHSVYSSARMHLDLAPNGAAVDRLRAALEDARRESDAQTTRKKEALLKEEAEKRFMANGNYGVVPSDIETQVRSYFATAIGERGDPRFDFVSVMRGWIRDCPEKNEKLRLGWIQIVGVDVRDERGRYTGYRDYNVFFLDGRLLCEVTTEMLAAKRAGFVE